jgi:hypothetical protein
MKLQDNDLGKLALEVLESATKVISEKEFT